MNRLAVFLTIGLAACVEADTTIDAAHSYAYAVNAGWLNARGDVTHGTVIGEFVCSGHIWGANVGWIHLGDGTPANGHQYGNDSASDFGVNHAGLGRLRGYAYGANVGWIAFEDQGNPRVDLANGNLTGYAWGANIGWISLSNAQAYVRTETMVPGGSGDGDSISDPWEYKFTNLLTVLYDGHDQDGDGVNDEDEEAADTNPLDPDDYLQITEVAAPGPDSVDVTWPSRPTRLYAIDCSTFLTGTPDWVDSPLGTFEPDPGPDTTRRVPQPGVTQRFYRVKAIVPALP